MFNKKRFLIAGLGTLLLSSSAFAQGKSYVMGGLGVQFDLAQLGGTIMKDGLDHRNPNQTAIYAENQLISLEKSSGGIVDAKTSGAMVGGNINLGYEKEGLFGNENLFWRINANYTTKVRGGETSATIARIPIVDQTWNYHAITLPAYMGIKLQNEKKTAGIFIGAGVHYFNGGWGVSGTIDPNIIPGQGIVTDAPRPGIYKENAQFRASGLGLNWIVGAEANVTEKGKVFFELETILSGAMSTTVTKSAGGSAALAPIVAYPVVLGGTTYRVGYKHEI